MHPRVVLKRLDDDCLLDGLLHPSIRLRLERVREIPTPAVANLHGVERLDGVPHLVWDSVPGRTLSEAAHEWRSAEQVAAAKREVLLAVQSMHAAGIVHGAVHERNVIVGDGGRVTLTHVSPLLYTDPADDLAAVEAMFDALVAEVGLASSDSVGDDDGERHPPEPAGDTTALRARSLVGAAAALALGVVVAGFVAWYSSGAP